MFWVVAILGTAAVIGLAVWDDLLLARRETRDDQEPFTHPR
jgi:hypothetical protein